MLAVVRLIRTQKVGIMPLTAARDGRRRAHWTTLSSIWDDQDDGDGPPPRRATTKTSPNEFRTELSKSDSQTTIWPEAFPSARVWVRERSGNHSTAVCG